MAFLRDLRQRGFARLYDRVNRRHEALVEARRRELCGRCDGTVLELGPGTGVNFGYLPVDSARFRWIGLEPNRHMHRTLLERAAAAGARAEVRGITAETMDVESESVDVVLSTLVLCSVDDPVRVLDDVHRALRPGGRFVFLEHVAAPSGSTLRRAQDLAAPLWRFVCDGCHPNRDVEAAIRRSGFAAVDVERFRLPVRDTLVVSPHIAGTATKAG